MRIGKAVNALVLTSALSLPVVVGAQGPDDSSIAGLVTDRTASAVAGAAVTISGPGLIGGARRVETAPDGTYRVPALPAGVYELACESPGFRTTRQVGIRLRPGVTLTVDVRLEVGGVAEVFEVRGYSPMVDVRSPASPTHFDQEMLQSLPTDRWLPSIVNLTPGVAGDVAFGGSQGSNGMYVDGVDITNPQFQDAWGRFNYNWVQEVQVVALGAAAEHGGFTGVSARSIFRSGSNRFAGLGEFWSTRPQFLSNNTGSLDENLQETFNAKELLSRWDANVQAGGPMARDRLWFFAGVQRVTDDSRPAGYTFEGSRREEDPRAIVKLSAAPSGSTRLEGFLQGGTYRVYGEGIDPYTPLEAAWDLRQPQFSWNARLTWTLGARTLLEAQGGGMSVKSASDPHAPATRSGPPPHYDFATGLYSENVSFFYDQEGSRQAATVSLTHYSEQYLGRHHQFKFGAEFERTQSREAWGTPGGIYYMDYAGEPYLAYLGGDTSVRSSTPRVALFVQDEWRISDHFTLSPGMRVAFNRGRVPEGDAVFSTTPVSPRLGVAWDVRGDHRTVVRAHYGRYHDPTFSSRISEDDTSDQSDTVLVAVVGPGEFVEIERYPPQDNFRVDPDITHSYVDQFVVGVERQVTSDLSAQVQYIRRNYDTFMGLIDTGSIWAPVPAQDTGPDGVAGTSDDGGPLTAYVKTNPGNEAYLYTNPPDAYRRYNGVQVIGRKRYSDGWQMQASYTWSRTEGTVSNHWHVNAARYDLGNPGTFVNPNNQINAFGRAPFDYTHEVKVMGSYRWRLWGGFLLSGVYQAHSGYAWLRVSRARVGGGGLQTIKVEPRGTRRTDAINKLDLRIEKTIPLDRRWRIGLFVDVFNLGNQGVPDAEQVAPIQEISGSTFGQPRKWVDPRTVRLGLRVTF